MRSPNAKAFIAAIAFLGVAEILAGALQWQTNDVQRFICYLAIALASSLVKVSLPGKVKAIGAEEQVRERQHEN